MAEDKTVFRKKTMERVSSPEQLADYLRVTNPGIWVLLAAVGLFLAGLIVWSAVGTLETTAEARALVKNGEAQVVAYGDTADVLQTGMPLRVASEETVIASVETDAYGRSVAHAYLPLPDGTYDAEVVTERVHPMEFLLEND